MRLRPITIGQIVEGDEKVCRKKHQRDIMTPALTREIRLKGVAITSLQPLSRREV